MFRDHAKSVRSVKKASCLKKKKKKQPDDWFEEDQQSFDEHGGMDDIQSLDVLLIPEITKQQKSTAQISFISSRRCSISRF